MGRYLMTRACSFIGFYATQNTIIRTCDTLQCSMATPRYQPGPCLQHRAADPISSQPANQTSFWLPSTTPIHIEGTHAIGKKTPSAKAMHGKTPTCLSTFINRPV